MQDHAETRSEHFGAHEIRTVRVMLHKYRNPMKFYCFFWVCKAFCGMIVLVGRVKSGFWIHINVSAQRCPKE